MIDIENLVFNIVATDLREKYTGIFVTGEATEKLSTFPTVTIEEKANTLYEKTVSNTCVEGAVRVLYEINIYSNIVPGRKAQAKAIVKDIDNKMLELGFNRVGKEPTETPNVDTNIYRILARYSGVITAQTISGNSSVFKVYRR